MSIKSFCKKVALGATLAVSSVFAFADDAVNKAWDVDLTPLTNNISFSGVLVALMAVVRDRLLRCIRVLRVFDGY